MLLNRIDAVKSEVQAITIPEQKETDLQGVLTGIDSVRSEIVRVRNETTKLKPAIAESTDLMSRKLEALMKIFETILNEKTDQLQTISETMTQMTHEDRDTMQQEIESLRKVGENIITAFLSNEKNVEQKLQEMTKTFEERPFAFNFTPAMMKQPEEKKKSLLTL